MKHTDVCVERCPAEWQFPQWGVSLRNQSGSQTQIFPIWSSNPPSEDCERDAWPYLLGVKFVITNGANFTAALAEVEFSLVDTDDVAAATLFTPERTVLVYSASSSIETLLFPRGLRLPAVEGRVDRLFVRVNPVVSPPPLPTWSVRAWGEYRPRNIWCCEACFRGEDCNCEPEA